MRISRRTIVVSVTAVTGLGLALLPGSGSGAATTDALKGDGIGTARFTTEGGGTVSPAADTITNWGSSFTDPTNGKTYNFSMVGTDPAKGDASTTIPTVIIPMSFTFAAASPNATVHTLNGADHVQDTLDSPVFQSADIGAAASDSASASPAENPKVPDGVAPNPRVVAEPSDFTQLGDAINRAQWGKSASDWHVLLGSPKVLPTLSFFVPKQQGAIIVGSRSHANIGLVSASWFSARLGNALRSLRISPRVLPIFLVNNTFLYVHTPGDCCILGYHGATSSFNGAGRQQINTYMFASYSQQGIFAAHPGDQESYVADIHGLSHEVQEWYDDPFVNNAVNPWLTPTAPQYGCTSDLETGDPVVGYGFEVTMGNDVTYHPEDEVHYSWFARESPSRAAGGYYTYLNNFASAAQGC